MAITSMDDQREVRAAAQRWLDATVKADANALDAGPRTGFDAHGSGVLCAAGASGPRGSSGPPPVLALGALLVAAAIARRRTR